jgi:hypothetical protein
VEGASLDSIGLILIVIGAIVAVAGVLMRGPFHRSRTRETLSPDGREGVVERDRTM